MPDSKSGTHSQVVDPTGGANQARVRVYNERLVLSLVRWHGELSKADIARRSGLSAQTVTVIMRQLEADGLLLKGQPIRGKVGQPSTPMRLNPEGAFAIGLKVDRRSSEMYLMDFTGTIRHSLGCTYAYPTPEAVVDFVRSTLPAMVAELPVRKQGRLAGLGIAIPFNMENWEKQLGAKPGSMAAWKGLDLAAQLEPIVRMPVFPQNDCTAACGAELLFGRGSNHANYAYVHAGYFIGGGVVLENTLWPGTTGNAGGFATVRITEAGKSVSLLDCASLHLLEDAIVADGMDPQPLWQDGGDWLAFGSHLDTWLERAARGIAEAMVSICSVIDFDAVMIDGPFPDHVRSRLVAAVTAALTTQDLSGISPFVVEEGSLGNEAQALGSASLPLMGRFLIDSGVLFRQ
ncbi:ROK family transcriptional regulator [Algicella marina]|uniref:ROK family protein n=1 Tax=Algicella marina TaxID=2683284 RepID=A0A6P1T468_9RHOB|nr:ROK family transcriptional regulator [Algicella marina]QHQ36561.1 ROK family protein [Algicella marina]